MRGIEFAPIEFELAGDLARWRAAVPGKVEAKAEALTGPTTPPGKRVQTINPPGSEVGPGGVATWGTSTVDRADALRLQMEPQRAVEQAHPVLVERPRLIGDLGRNDARGDTPRAAFALLSWRINLVVVVVLVVLSVLAWRSTIEDANSMRGMVMGLGQIGSRRPGQHERRRSCSRCG